MQNYSGHAHTKRVGVRMFQTLLNKIAVDIVNVVSAEEK